MSKKNLLALALIIVFFIIAGGIASYSWPPRQMNPAEKSANNADIIKRGQIKTISITAKQWEFIPNPIRVKQGDYVQLKITSADVSHGFKLPDFNINEVIEPGEEVVVNFLADKKGLFEFYCFIPCGRGHGNMRGELIVE